MKVQLSIFILLSSFFSCRTHSGEEGGKNFPGFQTYEEAVSFVKDARFQREDHIDIQHSSFLKSGGYYACDSLTGYMIIKIGGKDYIFAGVPVSDWNDFKESESKGQFF